MRIRRKLKQKKEQAQPEVRPDPLSKNLKKNLQDLRSLYADCFDVVFRSLKIGGNTEAAIVYIQGMSNIEEIDDNVLAPLMQETATDAEGLKALLEKKRIPVLNIGEVPTFADCVEHISIGHPVLLLDGEAQGIYLGLDKWEKRNVEEPVGESVVRGPRDGFIETLEVNTSLLRQKIRTPHLKMKSMKIGRYTQTKVVIAYIEGIADETLIKEITQRLKRIEIDGVLESGYIEELIKDNPWSPFFQVLSTERPDIAAASLLEGRVTILVDGTPFSLIAPTTFFSLMQSAEDYYQSFIPGTIIRWLRMLFVAVSLLLPSLYVAVLTYHQEMVPTPLLITIVSSREAIPFPALVEALLMEGIFEIVREAGIRLPKQVGAAVSIVGALVIGQAAVSAGLASPPMVLVVATTGVASIATPRYPIALTIRILRFPLLILAGMLGLLGVMLGVITIVVHLCHLRSFGVPYLTPVAPAQGRDWKDVLVRAPWWMMNTRPRLTGESNRYRQAPGQRPDPSKGDEK